MENRKIILTLVKDERLKPSDTFIGHEGDHLCTSLILKSDAFEDFKVHLKFKNVDRTFLSKALNYDEEKGQYEEFKIPQAILKKGNILCQLLFLNRNIDKNLDELNEKELSSLIVRQSSIVAFVCGNKIGTAAEGIDTTAGLFLIKTDGNGDKFLADDGEYHPIEKVTIPISSISINHEIIEPDKNKNVNIAVDKDLNKDSNNAIANSTVTAAVEELENKIPSLEGYAKEKWVNENYATKSELANLRQYKIVSNIEDVLEPQTNIIYLVYNESYSSIDNVYDEYIWANERWELIGTTKIDLSDYAQKSELPTKISELQNDSGFLTEHQDISHLQERLSDEQLSNIADIPNKVSADYVNTAIQTAITDVLGGAS